MELIFCENGVIIPAELELYPCGMELYSFGMEL